MIIDFEIENELKTKITEDDYRFMSERCGCPILSLLLETGVISQKNGSFSFTIFGNWLFRERGLAPFLIQGIDERGILLSVQNFASSPFTAFRKWASEITGSETNYLSRAGFVHHVMQEAPDELTLSVVAKAILLTDIMNASIVATKNLRSREIRFETNRAGNHRYSRLFVKLFVRLGVLPNNYLTLLQKAQKEGLLITENDSFANVRLHLVFQTSSTGKKNYNPKLTKSENSVFESFLSDGKKLTRSQVMSKTGLPSRTASRALVSLERQGYIDRIGNKGRKDSCYKLAQTLKK